ncbi:MAG TPA: Dabb family protein [Paracoccaceae bacterium]|nr:Dabb family protein [Paracoccaceae bacterium]
MIRHCVLLRLLPEHNASELDAVIAGLREVADRIEGCTSFLAGPNRDFEKKSLGYPYGFTMDFESRNALSVYAADAEHKALGGRLVRLCIGGAEGILVFDLDSEAGVKL